jgi:hypothetical protein
LNHRRIKIWKGITQINKNHNLEKEKVKQIDKGIDQANKEITIVLKLFEPHKQENTIPTIKDTGIA